MKKQLFIASLVLGTAIVSCSDAGQKRQESGGYDIERDSTGENLDARDSTGMSTDSIDTTEAKNGENAPPKGQ